MARAKISEDATGKSKRADPLNLLQSTWGLSRAKEAAGNILARPVLIKPLMRTLLSDDLTLRHRASDTTRRVAERNPDLVAPHAEDILGLFSEPTNGNWRTRAHLGLVVARIAQTRAQRLRAAGLLMPLYYDPSNVVRCTAIEGLAILAKQEPSLRPQFEAIAEEALATGTLAMKNRAHHGLVRLHARKR